METLKTAIHPLYQWLLCYSDGRIENLRYGNGKGNYHKWIKGSKTAKGYFKTALSDNGKAVVQPLVHRLIYEAFNGLIPEGYDVHHINKCRTDNRAENLILIERSEHLKLHNKRSILQYSKDGTFIREWESMDEAEKILGVFNQNISACCLGKIKSAGGYVWSYK